MIVAASISIFAQAFGWAVLHSIWQIALIWVLYKAMSWLLSGRNQAIYLISLGAMLMSSIWFFGTFISEYQQMLQLQEIETISAPALETAAMSLADHPTINTTTTDLSLVQSARLWFENHALLIGWAWALGVLLLWIRLLGGWWLVQRLRYQDVTHPSESFQQQCRRLADSLKINSLVKLLESPHVREPLTLGYWKPLILFPTGLLLTLSPAQVEALLLHELAHIRRHDYLVNMFQLALETCFFYHPLFWLISRDARVLREFCCDDVVLSKNSDPILYAQTLTNLQLSTHHLTTQFTMNATGKSRFTTRILRIAGVSPQREARPNWLLVMMFPLLLAIFSWGPMQASPDHLDAGQPDITLVLPDTVPPGKAKVPVPQAAPPKVDDAATRPADQVNKVPEIEIIEGPKVAIAAVKMNVLYIGADNPLRIAAADVPSQDLKVELIGNGTIEGGDGFYIVRPTTPGEVTIRVSKKRNGTVQVIDEQVYRVKRIPDPSARWGGLYKGGLITKEDLLKNKGITALLENFDFDAVCNVVGYELTIIAKGKEPRTFGSAGPSLGAPSLKALEALEGDGDAIFFDDIKVLCPGDAAPRNIGGIAFKLKATADK